MMIITPSSTMPLSLLDTDLYKISMQQAVWQHFPSVTATYKFVNRSPDRKWSQASVDHLQSLIQDFASISLQPDERQFLQMNCPFLTPAFLDFLEKYRFEPDHVKLDLAYTDLTNQLGDLEISITGPWHSTILWEVPLMAALSESFFIHQDTDWTLDGQAEQAYQKGLTLLRAGCTFSDFGSRRRRSFAAQDIVVANLARARDTFRKEARGGPRGLGGAFAGTSNVYLAMKYNLKPIGTIAHEWFMGIAAMKGYDGANLKALKLWTDTYSSGILRTALTDTFSSEVFFKDMTAHPEYLIEFPSLRQDSGDPFLFAPRAKQMYEQVKITYHDKVVVYSDGLTVDKCVALQEHVDKLGMKAAYGIGTHFTNDFMKKSNPRQKSKALNIVIKLLAVDGKGCVKISDDLTKNVGSPEDITYVKDLYHIPRS